MEEKALVTVSDSMFFNPVKFEFGQKIAVLLAKSDMVPTQFRNNPSNCFIAVNLAERLGIDVFGLMQAMYVVHGRPGVEAKLVISLINLSGRYSPLEWKFEGSGITELKVKRPDSCTCYATEIKTGKVKSVTVDWATVVAEGWLKAKKFRDGSGEMPSKWNTVPYLMFQYRSADWFRRLHCPEVLLGFREVGEVEDIEMVPAEDGYVPMTQAEPEAPQSEPPVPTPPDTSTFDKLFAEKKFSSTDKKLFAGFISYAAGKNTEIARKTNPDAPEVTEEQIKVAMAEDWPKTLTSFLKWKNQNKSGKRPPETTNEAPKPEGKGTDNQGQSAGMFHCPEVMRDVTAEVCETCPTLEGCPAHAEREPGQEG